MVSGWANGVEAADQSQLARQSAHPPAESEEEQPAANAPDDFDGAFQFLLRLHLVGASARFLRVGTLGRLHPRAKPHQHMIKTEFTLEQ